MAEMAQPSLAGMQSPWPGKKKKKKGWKGDKMSENSLFSVHFEPSQAKTKPSFYQAALIPLQLNISPRGSRLRERDPALLEQKTVQKMGIKPLFAWSKHIPETPNPRARTLEGAGNPDQYPALIKNLGWPFLGLRGEEKRGGEGWRAKDTRGQ